MKFSTYLSIILVIGVFFILFGMMINQTNNDYLSMNIDNSSWANSYDFSNDINRTIAPIQKTFTDIENPELGWFSKITSGLAAIPFAVIRLPLLIFDSFVYGGKIVTNSLGALGIPISVILIVCTMIALWGIFRLIETFQRWQV
jgi:hypothetical protein